MFKVLSQGFKKFINRKELVIAVVALVVGVAILSYSNTKTFSMDGLQDGSNHSQYGDSTNALAQPSVAETGAQHVGSSSSVKNAQMGSEYSERSVNSAQDLLPEKKNSEWDKLTDGVNNVAPDLLPPGSVIGINRTPLRNSNLQFRSDPVIPRQDIGPWNQSTIDQDISRIPLEVGYTGVC